MKNTITSEIYIIKAGNWKRDKLISVLKNTKNPNNSQKIFGEDNQKFYKKFDALKDLTPATIHSPVYWIRK